MISQSDFLLTHSLQKVYLQQNQKVFLDMYLPGGSKIFPGYTGRVRTRLGGFLRNQALNESTKVTLVLNDNKLLKSEIMALPR